MNCKVINKSLVNKRINFYYPVLNKETKRTSDRCLFDGYYQIDGRHTLDFEHHKNFRMNDKYDATDEDLYKFRDDTIAFNEDIKKLFFRNKDKVIFKVDVFHYHTFRDCVYNTIMINSNQHVINSIPGPTFRELCVFENCLSAGLMTVDKNILGIPMQVYGYDFEKFYYHMMKKIRVPTCNPKYTVIEEKSFVALAISITI